MIMMMVVMTTMMMIIIMIMIIIVIIIIITFTPGNNMTCTIYFNHRIAATLFTLETWFFRCVIVYTV
jgi:uncharacterized membrane protein YciS (DUF1049 family)